MNNDVPCSESDNYAVNAKFNCSKLDATTVCRLFGEQKTHFDPMGGVFGAAKSDSYAMNRDLAFVKIGSHAVTGLFKRRKSVVT